MSPPTRRRARRPVEWLRVRRSTTGVFPRRPLDRILRRKKGGKRAQVALASMLATASDAHFDDLPFMRGPFRAALGYAARNHDTPRSARNIPRASGDLLCDGEQQKDQHCRHGSRLSTGRLPVQLHSELRLARRVRLRRNQPEVREVEVLLRGAPGHPIEEVERFRTNVEAQAAR